MNSSTWRTRKTTVYELINRKHTSCWRAKETYRLIDENKIEDTSEIVEPGKDFMRYVHQGKAYKTKNQVVFNQSEKTERGLIYFITAGNFIKEKLPCQHNQGLNL